jgi:ribosomal protein S18 acetylase RimI-like enzyme
MALSATHGRASVPCAPDAGAGGVGDLRGEADGEPPSPSGLSPSPALSPTPAQRHAAGRGITRNAGLQAQPGQVRAATPQDIRALLRIEEACFPGDRITPRSFRHLLTRGNADTLVRLDEGLIVGYAMVLYHGSTSLARLYSFAVLPEFRRRGHAQALLQAAEAAALARQCIVMRLEVRPDNTASRHLYENSGYHQFGIYDDYYEDHASAVRYEKLLTPDRQPAMLPVPYYEQTTEFTCGPAALIMAMKALDTSLAADRAMELCIWRESTTVFMTSGHGGCGPHGLALSALRRGFAVELWLSTDAPMFLDGVRSERKRAVMRIIQHADAAALQAAGAPVHHGPISVGELEQGLGSGGVPVVLISTYAIYGAKFPHWVVVLGIDANFVYVHDPFVDHDRNKTVMDSIRMPIPRRTFERMARYGRSQQMAALILRRSAAGPSRVSAGVGA